MSEVTETIKTISSELLDQMGIMVDGLTVVEGEGVFQIEIASEADSGVLIGYHGETLQSFQQVLALLCYRSLGEWQRFLVDVEGYREVQREKLEGLAMSAAKRARFLEEPVTLSPMNSYERRLVHTIVSEVSGVCTESIGERRERRVVIYPGEKKDEN